jgi:hypothetical protein
LGEDPTPTLTAKESHHGHPTVIRAAYFGDRAGLLIATGTAVALMTSRTEEEGAVDRRVEAPVEG